MVIERSSLITPGENVFKNLGMGGSTSTSLVLQGWAIAGVDGSVRSVKTTVQRCDDRPPESCTGLPLAGGIFSSKTLVVPVPVLEGQRIDVTVRFTFQ